MAEHDTLIHQTLHGYLDGHRLLAASTALPTRSEQTMVILSDLSGHGVMRHFDEYVTGYPLPEIGAYALAKTWHASEMPRPGCVWTHTLLIPFVGLGSVQSLHSFVRLFVRPHANEINLFNNPVQMSTMKEPSESIGSAHAITECVGNVLCKLYESPNQPVVVPVAAPTIAEHPFFDIWSQQWPRLRRTFTFCTGAISGRRLDGHWFDLQGVPRKKIDDFLRTNDCAIVANLETLLPDQQIGNWCQAATDELVNSTNALRNFLFEFGAEAEGGRRDFVPMTKLFLAVREESGDPVKSLLDPLETVFSDSTKGVKFKTMLLTGQVGANALRAPKIRLRIVLEAKENLFKADDAQLKRLAQEAWAHNPRAVFAAIDAAFKAKKKPSTAIISAVANTLRPDHLADAQEFESAVLALAAHQPMILAHDAFKSVTTRNAVLLDHLTGTKVQPGEIRIILSQWLNEGDFDSLEMGAKTSPTTVIPATFDLLSSLARGVDKNFSTNQLIQLCERGPKRAEKWLFQNMQRLKDGQLPLRLAGCVMAAIELHAVRIRTDNVEGWEYLLANQKELDSGLRKAVVMRLFLRAMKVRDTSGARIATAAFPYLYRLLMKSQVSYGEWCTLQEAVGGSSWDWDRCRRLSKGLIDQFKTCKWPVKYFSTMLEDDAELASFLVSTRFYESRYDKFIARSLK